MCSFVWFELNKRKITFKSYPKICEKRLHVMERFVFAHRRALNSEHACECTLNFLKFTSLDTFVNTAWVFEIKLLLIFHFGLSRQTLVPFVKIRLFINHFVCLPFLWIPLLYINHWRINIDENRKSVCLHVVKSLDRRNQMFKQVSALN